ncbi:MAG TPA: nucleotidyltransferase domain-containing protein [Terriglobia bacterium]|nr:nucleotidyltransferase domain-containing protein [Terriglobia bacterium]
MNQLSEEQRDLVFSLVTRLGAIPGVRAVVLGGSHARRRAQPESDIDIGILYSEAAPFSISSLRALAEAVNDTASPVVTDFYGWGPWVNGGAWLTIRGQRVDFIYRSIEHLDRVIAEAQSGQYELDYAQQPPFGFFSATYLGEIAVCFPLFDPDGCVELLKRRVAEFPEALRRAVVQDYLWQAEFALVTFAPKVADRGDAFGTASCLSRAVNQLVLVLFALNRRYLINDKTALDEVEEFEHAPREFKQHVHQTFSMLGSSPSELKIATARIMQLHRETASLAGGLYVPRFKFPSQPDTMRG